MRLMTRRGPDDEGLWSDGKVCTMGTCRLAISDISPSGHQPMVSADGRYVLTYNGEVYNFPELRRELERHGMNFRSSGDTEVVLNALILWGTKALSRFNGMFALAFYDTGEQRLFLANDHAGIKPLYYLLSSRGAVYASQYDQLLQHPWSQNLPISEQALGLYLRLGYIPRPYAMLQNTYAIEPGSWIDITSQGVAKNVKYFVFPRSGNPQLHGPEANEACNAVITEAVRRQMRSDVPVGTFLSGGIDSPLVSAKLREATQNPFKAFTIGTNLDNFDESPDARRYAQEMGIDHIIKELTLDQLTDLVHDAVEACGEPFADNSIFPMLALSRLARDDVKVALSGDGGDELFWGYAGRFGSVLEHTSDFSSVHGGSRQKLDIQKLFALGIGQKNPLWPDSLGASYRMRATHIPEQWLRRIFKEVPRWPDEFQLYTHNSWETDETAQWLRWNEFTGPLRKILLKVDRGSMFHSLEVRVPFLDKEVVQLAMNVDWRSCLNVRRRMGKLPLRHALSRHVHHQSHFKRGFTISSEAGFRGPLRRMFEETVLSRKTILNLPIDGDVLREFFDRHLSGRADYGFGLWVILSLVLWEEKHFQRKTLSMGFFNQLPTFGV